jgi:hypothetical protein
MERMTAAALTEGMDDKWLEFLILERTLTLLFARIL